MNIASAFSRFRKPTPWWFSILRLLVIVAVFLWIGYDGNFKPVGTAVADGIAQFSADLKRQTAALQEEAERDAAISNKQQPTMNGVAK